MGWGLWWDKIKKRQLKRMRSKFQTAFGSVLVQPVFTTHCRRQLVEFGLATFQNFLVCLKYEIQNGVATVKIKSHGLKNDLLSD